MTEGSVHTALFHDLSPAVKALNKLRELGIRDKEITLITDGVAIISGVPYAEKALDRQVAHTAIAKFTAAGFLLGFITSILFDLGTSRGSAPHLGSLTFRPAPTDLALVFEISLFCMIVFTLIGVLWEFGFSNQTANIRHPQIGGGQVVLMFECPTRLHGQAHEALEALGAEWEQKA